MADLTISEVVQILNKLSSGDVIYVLDEEVENNPIPSLVYVCVKHPNRTGLYIVKDRLTSEDAVKHIRFILSMEYMKEEFAGVFTFEG